MPHTGHADLGLTTEPSQVQNLSSGIPPALHDQRDARRGDAHRAVTIDWHGRWSAAIDQAFAAMPSDPLMDRDFVRRLWFSSRGRGAQQVGVVRDPAGAVVGVLPLKRREFKGLISWQFLTQYAQPYARFYVLPEYTDATVAALHRYIACHNVAFYQPPAGSGVLLRPEESWVVHLPDSYAELMRRTKYREGRVRRRTANLRVEPDRYADLPAALAHWRRTWMERESPDTAKRSGELLTAYRIMAEQGRLKTFSLYDEDRFAGMIVNMVGGDQLYFLLTTTLDEYKPLSPGMFLILLSLEWACSHGFKEYDMLRTSGEYKRHWAVPEVRGYRFVATPGPVPALGRLGEQARRYYGGIGRRARRLPAWTLAQIESRVRRPA